MCRKLQFEEKFQVAAPVNVKIQYCNAFLLFKKKKHFLHSKYDNIDNNNIYSYKKHTQSN